MGHYDCKSCYASPWQEHSVDCERFGPRSLGRHEMTEITQADRDAAASGYFAWCSGNPVIPDRMKAGKADNHSMVQAFARHRIETTEELRAENERLNTLINETGGHWLALQNDHPIIWEGTIDAAMKAACDEIRRLRGITKPDPLVDAVKDILDDDSLHNAEEFSEAIRAALAKRGGRIVFDD